MDGRDFDLAVRRDPEGLDVNSGNHRRSSAGHAQHLATNSDLLAKTSTGSSATRAPRPRALSAMRVRMAVLPFPRGPYSRRSCEGGVPAPNCSSIPSVSPISTSRPANTGGTVPLPGRKGFSCAETGGMWRAYRTGQLPGERRGLA